MIGEMIVDSVTGNLVDKAVDRAVDGTIDSIKEKHAQNTTYVWTAINKETHGGQTANIIFINKLGQRRRVQWEQVANFCENNYVSNIVVNNGRPSMVGLTFSDLPNYMLRRDGTYNLVGRYSEQDIYNRAMAYIQSQERKIAEDIANNCLKGHDSDLGGTQSNFTENLGNVKNIAVAGAVTAVTTAGVAAAGGIGLGAAAIYRKINGKKLTEVQLDMYKQLKNYYNMIEGLIKVKEATNNRVADDKITKYSNQIEIDSCTKDNVKKLVTQYSIQGCINKLESSIEQCRNNAVSYKILDLPIKDNNGKKLGALSSYINSTTSRLEYLKHLHNNTKLLIDNNAQEIRQQEQANQQRLYHDEQQNRLVIDTDNDLTALGNQVRQFLHTSIDCDNAYDKQSEFSRLGLDAIISTIYGNINQIEDNNIRSSYQDRLNNIKNNKLTVEGRINSSISEKQSNLRNSITDSINTIEKNLSDLMLGRVEANKCNDVLSSISSDTMNARMQLQSSDLYDKDILLDRLNSIDNKLETNKRQINDGIQKAGKDQQALNNIDTKIANTENNISRLTKSKEIQVEIEKFSRIISYDIDKITNPDLTNTYRQKIDNKIKEFNNILADIIQKENDNEALKQNIKQEILDDINTELDKVSNFNVDEVTKESLNSFEINESDIEYKISSSELALSDQNALKNKLRDLKNKFNSKHRSAENILSREESAIQSLKSQIAELKVSINNIEINKPSSIKFEIPRIHKKIDMLPASSYYIKLRDKAWVDDEINVLNTLLNSKETN
jgi:hypothetical protein